MITFTTIGYSDIYPGKKPTVKQLLNGINSKIIIGLMAMINAELTDEKDIDEVQTRLTLFVMEQFPRTEAEMIFRKLKEWRNSVTLSP